MRSHQPPAIHFPQQQANQKGRDIIQFSVMLDAEVVIFFDFLITLQVSFILDERDSSFLKTETVGAETTEGNLERSMGAKISRDSRPFREWRSGWRGN